MITKAALIDLAERAAWTFVQVGAGALLLSGMAGTSAFYAAGLAGLTAVLSVVKSFAATQLGDPHSASFSDGPIANAILDDWKAEGLIGFIDEPYEHRGNDAS